MMRDNPIRAYRRNLAVRVVVTGTLVALAVPAFVTLALLGAAVEVTRG